jgi:pyrroline-5-carboxylate reductase
MQKQPIIAFMGCGNMAQSLISGLIESGFDRAHIWATDRNTDKREHVKSKFGIQTESDNIKAAKLSDVLILAVKPKDMHALVIELKDIFSTEKCLTISIATGIQTQHLERWIGAHVSIVRAMPNTPALLRAGATGLYANAKVTEEEKNIAESLMRAVGIAVWVDHEQDMDIIAALSGSGPAYFFLMMEALQQGAESLGLSSRAARLLTLQTALGAARIALESDISLDALRKKVASPGGITERALQNLESNGIRTLFYNALITAKNRSIEINQIFDQE